MAKTKKKKAAAAESSELDERFDEVDLNEMREEYQTEKAQRESMGGAGFYDWQTGENNFRILPLKAGTGKGKFFKRTLVHFQVGPDDRTFSCPRTLEESAKCWLCKRAADLLDSQDEKDKEEGKDLRPKQRFLYLVYDTDSIGDGIQIMEAGVSVHDDLMAYVLDDGWGKIWDLDQGYNVTITRKGKKRRTKYDVKVDKDSSAIDDEIRELLGEEELPDLNNLRKFSTQDEMKAAYYGEDEDEEEDDEEEDEEEETEEEETEEEDAEEDDDESSDDEEEEEDEDDAGDDDEEEDDEEEEDEEAGAAPKVGRKLSGKSAPPPKKATAKKSRNASARAKVAEALEKRNGKKSSPAKKGKGKKKK